MPFFVFFPNLLSTPITTVAVSGSFTANTGIGSFGSLDELTLDEGTIGGFTTVLNDDNTDFIWRAKISHPNFALMDKSVLVTDSGIYSWFRGTNTSNPQSFTIYNSDDSVFGTVSQAVPSGSYAAYVIKYNLLGVVQWVKRAWGPVLTTANAACNPLSIKLDPTDGNIIVTGQAASTTTSSGNWDLEIGEVGDTGYDASNTNLDDGWFGNEVQVKLASTDGEALTASFSRSNVTSTFLALYQQPGGLAVSETGLRASVYDFDKAGITVHSVRWDVGGGGDLIEAVQFQAHAAVASWSASGDLLWVNNIHDDGGTRNTTEAWRVLRADGYGVVAYGWTCSGGRTMTFDSQTAGATTLSPVKEYYWFALYDDLGDIVWIKHPVINLNSNVHDKFGDGLLMDALNDAFYLSGHTTGDGIAPGTTVTFGDGEAGQRTISFSGNYGHWVAKFNLSTGDFQWITRMNHLGAAAIDSSNVMGILDESDSIGIIWRNDTEADTLEFDDLASAGTSITSVSGKSLIKTVHNKSDGERLSLTQLSSAPDVSWRGSDSHTQ